jgi:putative hemolysin
MDPWVIEKILLIALLVGFSGFFSGSETALFSLPRIKREAMATRDDRRDRAVLGLLSNPRRLMVTLILCNELVNVGVSTLMAGLGEHAARRLGVDRPLWITLGTAVVTVPILVLLGDMAPKSVAIRVGERWARFAAGPLALFGFAVAPVRIVVRLVSDTLLNLVGGRPQTQQEGIREEEFRALVDVGEAEGEVENAERKLIHNVFEFGDRTVVEVMTPAERVFALPYEMPLGRLVEAVSASRYSRVPIYRRGGKEGIDHVVGVLYAKDLVGYGRGHLEGHTLKDLLKPPFFVPRSTKCDRLFREFQRRKTHLALVVDEYGRLVGLVTMEDLLEELFGEITDEKEARPPTEERRPAQPEVPR